MKTLQEVRMEHIRRVLKHTKGDLEEASRILGTSPQVLRSFIEKRGMKEFINLHACFPTKNEE